jgi:hypothetical protein
LQLAFAAPRMARENVENKLRAVDDATLGELFDVALLHGRKIAIENNQRRVMRDGFGANFVEFAAANERGGIGSIAHLKQRGGNFRAGARGQFDQLQQ